MSGLIYLAASRSSRKLVAPNCLVITDGSHRPETQVDVPSAILSANVRAYLLPDTTGHAGRSPFLPDGKKEIAVRNEFLTTPESSLPVASCGVPDLLPKKNRVSGSCKKESRTRFTVISLESYLPASGEGSNGGFMIFSSFFLSSISSISTEGVTIDAGIS
jgi:hypothetical protein